MNLHSTPRGHTDQFRWEMTHIKLYPMYGISTIFGLKCSNVILKIEYVSSVVSNLSRIKANGDKKWKCEINYSCQHIIPFVTKTTFTRTHTHATTFNHQNAR